MHYRLPCTSCRPTPGDIIRNLTPPHAEPRRHPRRYRSASLLLLPLLVVVSGCGSPTAPTAQELRAAHTKEVVSRCDHLRSLLAHEPDEDAIFAKAQVGGAGMGADMRAQCPRAMASYAVIDKRAHAPATIHVDANEITSDLAPPAPPVPVAPPTPTGRTYENQNCARRYAAASSPEWSEQEREEMRGYIDLDCAQLP